MRLNEKQRERLCLSRSPKSASDRKLEDRGPVEKKKLKKKGQTGESVWVDPPKTGLVQEKRNPRRGRSRGVSSHGENRKRACPKGESKSAEAVA